MKRGGITVQTVKLGELHVDRRVWVRDKINLDHVRCMVNDLVNGDVLPPLVIERKTKTIISGNHRYLAYKHFYGDNWKDAEVGVEWVDLPSFEEDPVAWYREALKDNQHLVERLGYSDRNLVAAATLRQIQDPASPQVQEIARLLHFTEQSWNEFSSLYLDSIKKKIEASEARGLDEIEDEPGPVKVEFRAGHKRVKFSVNDIQPPDAKLDIATPRAQLIARVNGLLRLLDEFPPGAVTPKEKALLNQLMRKIQELLERVA